MAAARRAEARATTAATMPAASSPIAPASEPETSRPTTPLAPATTAILRSSRHAGSAIAASAIVRARPDSEAKSWWPRNEGCR